MSSSNILKKIFDFLSGDFIPKTISNVEKSIQEGARKAVKSSILAFMFLIGFIFLLVGLAGFLQDKYFAVDGTGLLAVGGGLIALGILVKALK